MIICVIFQICVPLVNQFSLIFNRIEDYLSSCGLKKPDNLIRERDLPILQWELSSCLISENLHDEFL